MAMSEKTCERCGRRIWYRESARCNPCDWLAAQTVTVYANHEGYGCDTGCCGWRFTAEDERRIEFDHTFEFMHYAYLSGDAADRWEALEQDARSWAGKNGRTHGVTFARDLCDDPTKEYC